MAWAFGRLQSEGLLCSVFRFHLRELTEGNAPRGLVKNLGQGRSAECLFNHRKGIVEPAMERTEAKAVRGQAQRTGFDPLNGLHGVNDLKNRQILGLLGERHAAPQPSLRVNNPASSEALQDLRKIRARNLGYASDLLGRTGLGRLAGKIANSPEGVFDGLRKHKKSL
jgi:hypothetical protein